MTDKQRIAELERQVAKLEGKIEGMLTPLPVPVTPQFYPRYPHHGSTWCNCPQCTRYTWGTWTTGSTSDSITIGSTGTSSGTLVFNGSTLTFDDEKPI